MSDMRVWPAPAKLNLFLRITGRRSDGYHLLQTVFQFVGLADVLRFETTEDGRIVYRSSLPALVPAEGELCMRAAKALQNYSGCRRGAGIHLNKRIPVGGGLGGGSSNAATTLVALNRLWGLGLGESQLAEIALGLGADVPVFVRGRAAWAEGLGELLRPIELPQPWYLIVYPGCSVSTAGIFRAPDLTRQSAPITMEKFLAGEGGNDCVPVVRRLHPEVALAMDWLDDYAPTRLSGTGACVFAAFDERSQANAVRRRLPRGWRGEVCRGRNRSPLRALLLDEKT